MAAKKALAELLVSSNLLDLEQLEQARRDQKANGGRLTTAVVRLGYLKSDQLVEFLGQQYGLPTIEVVPAVREYRYVKARDEITSSARPVKDVRAQYGSLVAQVSLRTVHEIFEADRDGFVDTVVFNGVVSTVDPATGRPVTPCSAGPAPGS